MKASHESFVGRYCVLIVRILVISLAVCGGLNSRAAAAATVTYILDFDAPGGFSIYADASSGDNGGIVNYSIPLAGNVLTLDHRSPVTVAANFQPAGFNTLRSADISSPTLNPAILAGQPLLSSPNVIYGFGLEASDWGAEGITSLGTPDVTSDSAWDTPLLIATGTYDVSAGNPTFAHTAELFASVFDNNTGNELFPASVNTIVGSCIFCPPFQLDDVDLGNVPRGTQISATMTDEPEGLDWVLQSFTGPNGPIAGATVDPQTSEFSWNSSGAALGSYTAVVRGLHFESVGQIGNILFNLVPEPSALSLLAPTILAVLSSRRR